MPVLPPPPPDTPATRDDLVSWVGEHLGHLACDEPHASGLRGGQAAADAALAALDLTGYARRRSQVLPATARGASRMSPYVRHGLLTLPQLWAAAAAAPPADRTKYRDELLWQEYARHLYARLGAATRASLRTEPPVFGTADPWPREMACMDAVLDRARGRRLAGQPDPDVARLAVDGARPGTTGATGEDRLYRQLLDGSRAANRLGWQWTIGAGSGKPYGFSRWQVEKRAPGLCERCPLQRACPIEQWPDAADAGGRREPPMPADLRGGPTDRRTDDGGGTTGAAGRRVADRRVARRRRTRPGSRTRTCPRVFVFDEPLLRGCGCRASGWSSWPQTLAELDVRGAGWATRSRSWPDGGSRSPTRRCPASGDAAPRGRRRRRAPLAVAAPADRRVVALVLGLALTAATRRSPSGAGRVVARPTTAASDTLSRRPWRPPSSAARRSPPARRPGRAPGRPSGPRPASAVRGVFCAQVSTTRMRSPGLTGLVKRSRSRPVLASTGPGAGSTNSPAASDSTEVAVRDDAAEQRVGRGGLRVGVRVEGVAGEGGEVRRRPRR